MSALAVIAFLYLSVTAVLESVYALLELFSVLGIPFLILTAVRKRINAPRPYELYDFYVTPPKAKHGCSFPSRHAHSAFAIGVALCYSSPILGALLLILGALMCTARVLLGMHFTRDVLAGAIVGVLSTFIGKMIFTLI